MLIQNATIEDLIKELQSRMESGVISGRIKNGDNPVEINRFWMPETRQEIVRETRKGA